MARNTSLPRGMMDASSSFIILSEIREHETGNLYCGANALGGTLQSTFEVILEPNFGEFEH